MTSRFKRLFLIFAPFHALLTGAVQRDMARRSSDQVRGPKVLWKAVMWWNPLASIAYWVLGRRRITPDGVITPEQGTTITVESRPVSQERPVG